MWQVLLAAAVAGSGYFAKQLLHKNNSEPINDSHECCDLSPRTPPSSAENADTESSVFAEKNASIFRFSSASSGSKNSRKKLGRGGGFKGNKGNLEKKCGDGLVEDQRKSGRKFAVCLKKRRTSRNTSARAGSYDVKDKSSFGWGVGVGIMYMMSAGKAEISRLNSAVDETTKVVQELKAEISKRKSSRDLNISSSNARSTANQARVEGKNSQSVFQKSGTDNNNNIEAYGLPVTEEGEYASSIITEEPHADALEIDQLEAELESELLKLPGCTAESPSTVKNKVSAEDFSKKDDLISDFNQCNGVMPYELDQKLCHLLIDQQESQIVELESQLQRTNSKLSQKEAELQALKDCVKRLTKFSLACPSDEETEAQIYEENINDGVHDKMVNERSVIGIKRAIDFD